MFNRDFWSEIFMALRRNKLRTILTGFAISWGIFMLIILLSAGNGLKNGVTSNFADRIKNTYTIWSSSTELPYKGHKAGRFIMLSNKDIQLLESLYQVDEVSPVKRRHSHPQRKIEKHLYRRREADLQEY